jgi:hypothetical protein
VTIAEPGAPADQLRAGRAAERPPWVSQHRYALLSGALVLLLLSYLLKFTWPGAVDIWEHAAAARELGARPFNPRHPLLPVSRPHQFFSPYLMAVGLLARLTGVSVITALNVAKVFNLILLLVGLRLFVRRLSPLPHVDFYALVFILFLWGPGAWFFSGFLHFDVVFVVLSYPSTFAKGLVLVALWAHVNYVDRDDARWLLPTLAISTVVLLTHPVDAIFLGTGALSLSLTRSGPRARHVMWTMLTLGASLLLAFCWPPLPLYDLLFGDASAAYRRSIAAADQDMYVDVLPRLGLALVVVPFALRRLWSWRTDPLVLMFFGGLLAYGYGYLTDEWSYGRLISSVQIVGAIILAEERAKAAQTAAAMGPAGLLRLRFLQLATAVIVLSGVYLMRNGFTVLPDRLVADAPYNWVHGYVDEVKISDFAFLAKNHETYGIVLSDLYTSLEVPVFGSKVVAFARTQAFVDTTERGNDVQRFYDRAATPEARRAIIAKYGVSLLIVPVDHLNEDPVLYRPLLDLGRVVSRNHRFVFVDLRPG